MAEPLPEKLKWMGRLGPTALWCLEDPPSSHEALAEELGVSISEINELRADAVRTRLGILTANAVLLVKVEPSQDPMEEFFDLHAKRYDITRRTGEPRPKLEAAVAEAFPEFNETNNTSAAVAQWGAGAQKVLLGAGYFWNEDLRRAGVLNEDGTRPPNSPRGLFTDVAIALFIEWYGVTRPVSKKRVEPIARVLGWFFQPELVGRAEKRIRDHLFSSAARKTP